MRSDQREAHKIAVDRLLGSYRRVPSTQPIRLAKPTSNLFRPRAAAPERGLDVSGLRGVIDVDPSTRTADVQGMCTYEDLVAATLPHALMPLVVPQLRTITLGGAVTGLGIESSSWRHGLPHESVLDMDVLTGDGRIVTASPSEHEGLFRGFGNSYGTLGYATRIRIELMPVAPCVALRHVPFESAEALFAAVGDICASGSWAGQTVDFLDGTVFGPDESHLTLGRWSEQTGPTSDYTGQRIYYRSIRERSEDLLTTHDYLWRWDTDWFWCSRGFGAQHPLVRRIWPRRLRRSDVYHRIVRLEQRHEVVARIDRWRGKADNERVVQDVEVPLERSADFLRWLLAHVRMTPVWLCPLRLRSERSWTLYPLQPGRDYVNFGFWGMVPIKPGRADGDVNRAIEHAVAERDGHKSLYSDAYYSREEFRDAYGGAAYDELKRTYDPDDRLLDLYTKVVQRG